MMGITQDTCMSAASSPDFGPGAGVVLCGVQSGLAAHTRTVLLHGPQGVPAKCRGARLGFPLAVLPQSELLLPCNLQPRGEGDKGGAPGKAETACSAC